MSTAPSPTDPPEDQRTSEDQLKAGDLAASEGRWRDAERHWQEAGAIGEGRLRWLQGHHYRPPKAQRGRAIQLWGVSLTASMVVLAHLVGLLTADPSPPLALVLLGFVAVALVATLLAALATGRWLDGTGTQPAIHPEERP